MAGNDAAQSLRDAFRYLPQHTIEGILGPNIGHTVEGWMGMQPEPSIGIPMGQAAPVPANDPWLTEQTQKATRSFANQPQQQAAPPPRRVPRTR